MGRILLYVLVLVALFGCGRSKVAEQNDRVSILVSNFALFDFARAIGGEYVHVDMLLSPGVEAHSYEPTPKDIVKVSKSDMLVVIGEDVEPWVGELLASKETQSVQVVEAGENVSFLSAENGHTCTEHDHHDNHDSDAKDPHIWLDPLRAKEMVATITEHLIAVDSSHNTYYEKRGDSLQLALEQFHNRCEESFVNLKEKTIVYAGHFAFGYFADRYGFEHVSPYHGFSPNSEPSPAKIAELIELIKEKSVRTIFYEELMEPRIARVLKEETGVSMELLHGIHNVSSRELQGTFSYLKGMEENRRKLVEALQ